MVKKTISPDQMGLQARRAALALLADVQGGALLSDGGRIVAPLAPPDRARALRLADDLCRWADRADRLLGPYLRMKPYDAVLNVLRLGVIEMMVHQTAAHGVVDAMVTLVGENAETSRAPGLVNAVLRKVAAKPEAWEALPMPRLPKPLRAPLLKAYGKAAVAEMEAAHASGAPLDLTLHPQAGDATRNFEEMKPVVLPNGSIRIANSGRVSDLPGYQNGSWWVQDVAASLPAQILAPVQGARVLDLCAAPGGKTMQLAAMGAQVTALDQSEKRMERVRENLERTQLDAELVIADAVTYQGDLFDAVLLDAPCSATGTIRRHPDLPIAKARLDFSELQTLQRQMLRNAADLVRPGGRLVYCTCSLFPAEGEEQVHAILAERPDLALDLPALAVPGVDPGWITETGLRTRPDYWPDLGGMDGFFIAAFRKTAES